MASAWLFDRTLVVDPEARRVALEPARLPSLLIAASVGVVPASLVAIELSGRYVLATGGYVLLAAYGFLAIALAVVPWLPGNKALVVDVGAGELRTKAGRARLLGVRVERAVDARGAPRATLVAKVEAGPDVPVLYLANDGARLVERLAEVMSSGSAPWPNDLAFELSRVHRQSIVSAVLLVAVGLGFGGFLAARYAFDPLAP